MIRLLWASQLKGQGNAYGYSTQANMMKAALKARPDVQVIEELGHPFDIAIHVITPDQFSPIDGKPNLLFTMYEATSIPDIWGKVINYADILVVPCEHNRRLFQSYYKRGKVERCRLGIDPERFPFYQRKQPRDDEPFRFLWVGAPNPRKGFQLCLASWTMWLRKRTMPRNVQLYMKSSGTDEAQIVKFKAAVQQKDAPAGAPLGPDGKPQKEYVVDFFEEKFCNKEAPELPGIVFDTFDYTPQQMTDLYNSAHAFILPSVGEGWGLTLAEAMATGAPCIWTHWSGPKDFADETTGFPVTKFSMGELQMMQAKKNEDGTSKVYVAHKSYGAIAHCDAIMARTTQIYGGYERALLRGKKASERMHAQFKWSDCAEEFVQICKRHLAG
jgi:glycosyltransferase involved in cell wall biosynthesis